MESKRPWHSRRFYGFSLLTAVELADIFTGALGYGTLNTATKLIGFLLGSGLLIYGELKAEKVLRF